MDQQHKETTVDRWRRGGGVEHQVLLERRYSFSGGEGTNYQGVKKGTRQDKNEIRRNNTKNHEKLRKETKRK